MSGILFLEPEKEDREGEISGQPLKSPLAVSSEVLLYITKQYGCAAITLGLNC